jgi:hypothetical protein
MPLVLCSWVERKDTCAAMNVFCTAILFLCLSNPALLGQSTTFQQIDLFTYGRSDHSFTSASLQPAFTYNHVTYADVAASQSIGLFMRRFYNKGTSSRSLRPWRSDYQTYATAAASRVSTPFAHTSFDKSTRCSGGRLEPSQIASCIGLLGFDRPALNRVQKLAVHVMRHYSWEEGMRVNRECVRSLSCSSLYEKWAVQRRALKPPN